MNDSDTVFGLLATTRYVPRLRLERSEVAAQHRWMAPGLKSLAKGQRAMANWDEDVVTMAVEASRTLRAVVEAPFLSNEQKIETLYLAAITRKPRAEELEFLKAHVASKTTDDERKQAYAEIMWGLLNGPEFVLSR